MFLVVDKTTTTPECPEGKIVGDINLFIDENNSNTAEINVMIAEPSARGKGLGEEWLQPFLPSFPQMFKLILFFNSVRMIIEHGNTHLKIVKFLAKISMSNQASIHLFKKLNFIVCFFFLGVLFIVQSRN